MKNLKLLGLVALTVMFFTACEEDPVGGGGTNTTGPSVLLLSGTDLINEDATLPENSTFSVQLNAEKGESELNGVSVYEEGALIDASRITFNGTQAGGNPILVVAPDRDGFTWDMTVDAQNGAGESKSFSFEVVDAAQNTDSYSVLITTEDDGGGGGTGVAPTMSVFGTGELGAAPGNTVCFKITAERGSSDLLSMEVTESGTLVPSNLLSFGGQAAAANPFGLGSGFAGGFTDAELCVLPEFFGLNDYTVVLKDEEGLSSELNLKVNVGTTPTTLMNNVLFNQAGPAGTGGLDLDNGMGVGSIDASAEIRDLGIDQSLPNDQNWIQRIAGANLAEVRQLIAGAGGFPDGAGFDDILYKESISDFFNGAAPLTSNTTGLIQVGDMFAVENNGTYYAFIIREVNVTANDNGDNYVLDIKL